MKKVLIIIYLVVFFLILSTCVSDKKEPVPKTVSTETVAQIDLVKAKQLLESSCFICHSPTAPENSRLAPPMEAVKRRYLRTYPKMEDFTQAMVDFVANPTEEKVLMFGAVDRFNLMTPVPFPEEDLRAIATYIYEYELEQPEWFEEHYNEMHENRGNGNGRGRGMGRTGN